MLKVRAIAGLHVVVLAWDFVEEQSTAPALSPRLVGLLGFAVEREEYDVNGAVVERYMMRGMKRFRVKDEGLPPGTPVPLNEHPVQTFQWSDYTTVPGTTYTYRVIPMYGKPKNLLSDLAASVQITVTTESEADDRGAGVARHDIYFNRGVIGSQAYSRKFANVEPDEQQPASGPMKWLSRGLFEGLLAFIARAQDERYALRCAFYEFRYVPVAIALRAAVDAGADVKIVYDATKGYVEENEATLAYAQLLHEDISTARTVSTGIRHNKFMVLLEGDTPVAVWTGSTNISAGGIFGHSNVGHAVWDAAIAAAYLAYWERLQANMTPGEIRPLNRAQTPTPAGIPAKGVTPLFSARDDTYETLEWYADRMADAKRLVCLTVAFSLDPLFQRVLSQENDVLRYLVKDDDLASAETVGRDRDVVFASGGRFDDNALPGFLGERDNPLNRNDYIHTKFMLVDPLGADPLVVTGSANFSRASQRNNDENMLVIRGDTRVADIYFGEFVRIFEHHYVRYVVRKLRDEDKGDRDAGYLREQAADWVRPHFDGNHRKWKRRRYFMEQ